MYLNVKFSLFARCSCVSCSTWLQLSRACSSVLSLTELCWCSQLYWGAWPKGLCPWAPGLSPWAEPQLRLAVAVLTVQAAGTWNSHVPQHAVPFLTQQDILGDFTMGTQGKNQSLTKQDGIFSMILPVVQHLGSPDIIKLCLVVPSFLSTGRSSFKQLFSWLSHRQQCIRCWARDFTSLG